MKDSIIDIFHFFIKKLTGNPGPIIKEEQVDKFLLKIDKIYGLKTLGDWWAWTYLSFQFAYWSSKKTRFNGNIPVNWVLGDKAIERWNSKPESWYYYTNLFLARYEISRPVHYYKGSVNQLFELERKRFHNTDEGFLNCLSFSEYSPKSVSCLTCKFRSKCKKRE